jgi:hypothetical protein
LDIRRRALMRVLHPRDDKPSLRFPLQGKPVHVALQSPMLLFPISIMEFEHKFIIYEGFGVLHGQVGHLDLIKDLIYVVGQYGHDFGEHLLCAVVIVIYIGGGRVFIIAKAYHALERFHIALLHSRSIKFDDGEDLTVIRCIFDGCVLDIVGPAPDEKKCEKKDGSAWKSQHGMLLMVCAVAWTLYYLGLSSDRKHKSNPNP